MRSRTPDVLHFLLTLTLALLLAWSHFSRPALTPDQAAQIDAGFRTYRYFAAPMVKDGPPRYQLLENLLVQKQKK